MSTAVSPDTKTNNEILRNYRDRAFLLVLADTGLRVHEACSLDRGSVDWFEGKAIVEIKGGRESVVRFSATLPSNPKGIPRCEI